MSKPNIVLCKPKSAMCKLFCTVCKLINLRNSEMFCKIQLKRGLFLHAYHVPHISGSIRQSHFLGQKSLLSLSQFSRVCPPMPFLRHRHSPASTSRDSSRPHPLPFFAMLAMLSRRPGSTLPFRATVLVPVSWTRRP
jgi:hypothetical protein